MCLLVALELLSSCGQEGAGSFAPGVSEEVGAKIDSVRLKMVTDIAYYYRSQQRRCVCKAQRKAVDSGYRQIEKTGETAN
jgi:hypothetical protein